MKRIAKEFERHGMNWKQLRRNEQYAIYEGSPASGGLQGTPLEWEVIKVIIKPTASINGRTIEGGESYPSPNQWGTYGITVKDKELAITVYQTVTTDPEPLGIWTYTNKLRKGTGNRVKGFQGQALTQGEILKQCTGKRANSFKIKSSLNTA